MFRPFAVEAHSNVKHLPGQRRLFACYTNFKVLIPEPCYVLALRIAIMAVALYVTFGLF